MNVRNRYGTGKLKMLGAIGLAVVALLLAFGLVGGATPAYAKDTPDRSGETVVASPKGGPVDQAMKNGAAEAVRAAIDTQAASVDVSAYGLTSAEARELVGNVFCEYPELFYLNGVGVTTSNGKAKTVKLTYRYTDLIPQMRSDYKAGLEKALAALAWLRAEDDESTVAKAVHDYLCKNVTYSYCLNEPLLSGNPNYEPYCAYGALVNHRCVCKGYSLAYKAIMNALGYADRCQIVFGISYLPNGEFNEYHIWNALKVDGQWYQVDLVADDKNNPIIPMVDCFLKSSLVRHEYRTAQFEGKISIPSHSGAVGLYKNSVEYTSTSYDSKTVKDWPTFLGQCRIDVGATLDGKPVVSNAYGTFDITIRNPEGSVSNKMSRTGVSSYTGALPAGWTWQVSNVKPKSGYLFDEAVASGITGTVADGDSNAEVSIPFCKERAARSVTLELGSYASAISMDGKSVAAKSISLPEGMSAKVVVTPKTDKIVTGWEATTAVGKKAGWKMVPVVGEKNTWLLTAGTANVKLRPEGRMTKHTLTITLGAGLKSASIGGKSTKTVTLSEGAKVKIATAESTGYRFEKWTTTKGSGTGSKLGLDKDGTGGTATFTMGTDNVTLKATAVKLVGGKLTVSKATGIDSATLDGGATSAAFVEEGDAVALHAKVKSGYEFDRWVVNSGTATIRNATSPDATVAMGSGNATVKATTKPMHTFKLTKGTGISAFTIDGKSATSMSLPEGRSVTVVVTVKSGYTFSGISGFSATTGSKTGYSLVPVKGKANTFTFTMGTGAATLKATATK